MRSGSEGGCGTRVVIVGSEITCAFALSDHSTVGVGVVSPPAPTPTLRPNFHQKSKKLSAEQQSLNAWPDSEGRGSDLVPVPVDRATLEEIADATGGSYSEAASAAELEQVYQDLGSQIGYTTEARDVSYWFVRGGVLFALLGVVLSLLWTNRLL